MFISRQKYKLISKNIRKLEDELFIVKLNIKTLVDAYNKKKAKDRHPASPKKTTTKKVEKNGK